MGIFSKSKEKNKLVLVFDIRSASVGGALVLMQESGIPKIIFSIREPITLHKTIDVEKFLFLTLKPLSNIVSKISKAGFGIPQQFFCVLSSPWYVSETRIISLKKDEPFTFTSNLADDLIKKETALFEEEHLAKYVHSGHKIKLIELKNIKTMLNNYETQSPLDKQAKELEMNIFISMSPEQILFRIEETVRKFFHFENMKFSSFLLSSFTIVRDMYTNQNGFLLIDIGGEVTDISMIKKAILCESISFPLGSNFIIRRIAFTLCCTFGEAESLFFLLKDEHADLATEEKMKPIIEKLKKEWLQSFQESLVNISNDISIPATIYLTVDKTFASFFAKVIENEQFNQYTLTESKFKIVFLDTETLHGIATFGDNTIRDQFMIVNAVYINRFLIKI